MLSIAIYTEVPDLPDMAAMLRDIAEQIDDGQSVNAGYPYWVIDGYAEPADDSDPLGGDGEDD